MNNKTEELIESYNGKYKKKGILGKQYSINLYIYAAHIAGDAFEYRENELGENTIPFFIPYESIRKMYIGRAESDSNITIEYKKDSVVSFNGIIMLMGIEEPQRIIEIIEKQKEKYLIERDKTIKKEIEAKERQKQYEIQKEEDAKRFYQECYDFYIKETTPTYQIFSDKNKIAVLFIDEEKGLNFLKIDGYEKEENRGIITYKNMHYYEKAGNIHYTTDIHGNYSSFGGGVTGGNFSKLAAVGGGALFGLMGMAVGAALTYKPVEQKPFKTEFSIDSDVRTIDDRNVILNFYSDSKQQYVDIELPYDIYNFLSTYLPEKKYSIVEELEKRTVLQQSGNAIGNGNLLNGASVQGIEAKDESSDDVFARKIKKLKMMRDEGLLSDEEFDNKRKELLDMI